MYENLTDEELYSMGKEYESEAHTAAIRMQEASNPEEADALRNESQRLGKKAMDCFLEAAKNGHANAQFALGGWLSGVFFLHNTAVPWMERAAQQGHVGACDYLVEIYENGYDKGRDIGENVEIDPEKAKYWKAQAIRYHSMKQAGYVQEKMAQEVQTKTKPVTTASYMLLVAEIIAFFGSPFVLTVLFCIDKLFLRRWQSGILKGYFPQELLLREKIAGYIHIFFLIAIVFKHWVWCLLVWAIYIISPKMRVGMTDWSNPSTWDWEKYAKQLEEEL